MLLGSRPDLSSVLKFVLPRRRIRRKRTSAELDGLICFVGRSFMTQPVTAVFTIDTISSVLASDTTAGRQPQC